MTRFQVKCRRCRLWLMSEESVVDCHGDSVQGDVWDWDCGDGQERSTITHLFVSTSLPPPFILASVQQACYTQGKITCPKCQGRLGSFDFLRTNRKCSCRQAALPPIHLLRDRVDLQSPSLTSHAALPRPLAHSTPSFRATDGCDPVLEQSGNGTAWSAHSDNINAEGTVSPGSLPTEEGTDTEKTPSPEKIMSRDENVAKVSDTSDDEEEKAMDGNGAVKEGEENAEDAILALRWLFRQLPSLQQYSASISGRHAEQCGGSSACQSEESSDSVTDESEHLCDVAPAPQTMARSVSASHQATSSAGSAQMRGCPGGMVSNITHVIVNTAKREGKREKRRKRNRRRDSEDGDNGIVSAGARSGCPVQGSPANPPLFPSPYQRQRERKEQEMKEERRRVEEEEVLWDHTCPMCLEVMWSPHTTSPCQHTFCEGCLRRLSSASSSSSKSDCPLCRQRIAACVPNTEMERIIQDKYPAHLRQRRREERRRRHHQRLKHAPLPGLPFPQRYLSRFPPHRLSLSRSCRKGLMVALVSVVVVMALSSVGMTICRKVLRRLAEVYDDLTERLTGERLWSTFMGVESRMLTVSCVFVLYLLVASIVHYLQLFRHIHV
ncbi:uncharacterized protein LOC143283088 [Babylonia areolata]|uniref:uncharacterized protein LOC143283088 n=1 Tax=Babylonia areolata TaxID=304850 RepID=UPI003FD2C974